MQGVKKYSLPTIPKICKLGWYRNGETYSPRQRVYNSVVRICLAIIFMSLRAQRYGGKTNSQNEITTS